MKNAFSVLRLSMCFIIIFVLSGGLSAQNNGIYIMFARGDSLYNIIKNDKDSIFVIRFKTDNGQDFYADAYVHKKGYEPPFRQLLFVEKVLSPRQLQPPYSFQTLRWKYKDSVTDIIDSTDQYLLIPKMGDSASVIYVVRSLKAAIDKLPQLPPPFDREKALKEFDKLPDAIKQELVEKAIQLLANAGGFNPVPPKLVP